VTAADDLPRLVNGYRATQAVHVAADLGLSDLLAGGPRSAADLASAAGCDQRVLYRLLRALATLGVYEEQPDGRFACTALGDELRSGGPLTDWARFVGTDAYWRAWGALGHSVRTGENAFAAVHGEGVWEYRARHPALEAVFDAAMAAMTRDVAGAVLDAYDFGRFAAVVDVGGGNGALLAALLARHPDVRGVLVDQPQVVAGAPAVLAGAAWPTGARSWAATCSPTCRPAATPTCSSRCSTTGPTTGRPTSCGRCGARWARPPRWCWRNA
jgi:hypothetical protein